MKTWCLHTDRRKLNDPPKGDRQPSKSKEPEDDSWPDDWGKAGDVDN